MRHDRKLQIPVFLAAFAILALLGPRDAAAQYYANEDDGLLISSTTTTTTAIVAGGIILTVVNLLPDDQEATAMAVYLRNNPVAVRHDVTLGAGESVADLGALLSVPKPALPTFGRLLRANRQILLELANPHGMDRDRAAGFIVAVRRTMASDLVFEHHAATGS